MSDVQPTYAFEDDDVYAIYDGQVIASGKDFSKVEETALDYLEGIKSQVEAEHLENTKRSATHIVTPNGLKGKILGRTAALFDTDEVTVRMENNQIRTLRVSADTGYKFVREQHKTASSPVSGLEERLNATYAHDRASLVERRKTLKGISEEARALLQKGTSHTDSQKLDGIRTAATREALEVGEAIDHLDRADAEAFQPPAPFAPQAVEQADIGRGHGDGWLESTLEDMVSEHEGEDYAKLLKEGPELLVSDLDDGAVADQGSVALVASSFIDAKTAGYEGDEVEQYRRDFLARVEQVRRSELRERQANVKKEAATEQETVETAPDASLFL